MRRPRLYGPALILGAVLLGGCASTPLQHRHLPPPEAGAATAVELAEVAFHPQQAYHCGPASLATLMNWQGEPVQPDELAPRVFLAGRQGSLQAEMLAGARRQGLLPYVHPPRFEALLAELDAGNPVLVLKNLGFERRPVWHYAVVIGYDRERAQVVMRSGTTERKVLSFRRFERRWQGGEYWAITLHQPGAFPAGAEEGRYLRAAAGLEQAGRLREADAAYRAAAARWPHSMTAPLGVGNVQYRLQRYEEAAVAYRAALERDPDSAAAHHNLAWALMRLDRNEEARRHALAARRLAPEQGEHYAGAWEALQQQDRL
ncbi:PA2778 family cysteine peptidase [Ectothiorhodospiraceae bacterium 2226]|nr:PA2778 family cysteine peptidase [Ectothiorhodospiraceae bacterium 2226]